jgi:hypothetical protein
VQEAFDVAGSQSASGSDRPPLSAWLARLGLLVCFIPDDLSLFPAGKSAEFRLCVDEPVAGQTPLTSLFLNRSSRVRRLGVPKVLIAAMVALAG